MESRVRYIFCIILFTFLLVSVSCDRNNSSNQSVVIDNTTISASSEFEVSLNYEAPLEYVSDIPIKEPSMTFVDDPYRSEHVRLYTDEDFYQYDENGNLRVIASLVDNETHYYSHEEVMSWNVGDYLVIDEDVRILIESLDVNVAQYVNSAYIEREHIVLGENYVLLHNYNAPESVWDYWVLYQIVSNGTSVSIIEVHEQIGVVELTIAEDCIISVDDSDGELWDYSVYEYQDVTDSICFYVLTSEFVEFITSQDDYYQTPLAIPVNIDYEDGLVTYISILEYSRYGHAYKLE